tara:strand:+ start:2274 stop:2591 length:318 start_codon:yes stop_codon:yes gene_type:complete
MTEKLNKLRQVKDSVFKHDVSKESSPLLFKPSYIHKEKIDNIIKNKVIEMKELCEMYPNDADLGKEIRKIAMSIKKKCDCFHSYDDYMDDQERLCANCGQEESKH